MDNKWVVVQLDFVLKKRFKKSNDHLVRTMHTVQENSYRSTEYSAKVLIQDFEYGIGEHGSYRIRKLCLDNQGHINYNNLSVFVYKLELTNLDMMNWDLLKAKCNEYGARSIYSKYNKNYSDKELEQIRDDITGIKVTKYAYDGEELKYDRTMRISECGDLYLMIGYTDYRDYNHDIKPGDIVKINQWPYIGIVYDAPITRKYCMPGWDDAYYVLEPNGSVYPDKFDYEDLQVIHDATCIKTVSLNNNSISIEAGSYKYTYYCSIIDKIKNFINRKNKNYSILEFKNNDIIFEDDLKRIIPDHELQYEDLHNIQNFDWVTDKLIDRLTVCVLSKYNYDGGVIEKIYRSLDGIIIKKELV